MEDKGIKTLPYVFHHLKIGWAENKLVKLILLFNKHLRNNGLNGTLVHLEEIAKNFSEEEIERLKVYPKKRKRKSYDVEDKEEESL